MVNADKSKFVFHRELRGLPLLTGSILLALVFSHWVQDQNPVKVRLTVNQHTMAPLLSTFPSSTSPNGMTVDLSHQSSLSSMSPLQDPFFYSNVLQRADISEFEKAPPMNVGEDRENHHDDDDNVSHEGDSCCSSVDLDEEDAFLPGPPKRRHSRNNFACVIQRISFTVKPDDGRKSVRFPDDQKRLAQIIEIESHKDFSSRERNRCWWSTSEKEKCMSKHERVVSRMEHRKPARKHETYRGLESWTQQGASKLDEIINLCVDAVMDEQDNQWKNNKDDFERIASISQRVTAHSAKRARHVGLKDEREAFLVRAQSWTEEDDFTVGSAMGASVLTAAKRKKKMATLHDKRDPTAKKLSKRIGKSSSSKNKSKHPSSSSSNLDRKSLDTSESNKHASKSSNTEPRSTMDSSKKSHSDRSRSSNKPKKESSARTSRTSEEKTIPSSSSSVVSSSKKKKSSSSVSKADPPNSTKSTSSSKRPLSPSKKYPGSIHNSTPPTSFSSTSSSHMDESSALVDFIRRQNSRNKINIGDKCVSNPLHRPKTINGSGHCISDALSSSTSSVNTKASDPPGRRATRSKSGHADKALTTMQSTSKRNADE